MSTYISIHNVKEVSARTNGTSGAPVTICLVQGANGKDFGHETEITFYTDSLPLSRRIAEAINDAVKPADKLTATQSETATELADVLALSGCSLEEAKTLLRAALSDYENYLEDAWQSQQEQLAESGGTDDSTYRRDMINAGRGHLLR